MKRMSTSSKVFSIYLLPSEISIKAVFTRIVKIGGILSDIMESKVECCRIEVKKDTRELKEKGKKKKVQPESK